MLIARRSLRPAFDGSLYEYIGGSDEGTDS
jgi:hypothetical protein